MKPSKIPGWDEVSYDDIMMKGDIYCTGDYYDKYGFRINIDQCLERIREDWAGKSWIELHGVYGYSILRRNKDWKPLPKRLAMSKVFSKPLPLP